MAELDYATRRQHMVGKLERILAQIEKHGRALYSLDEKTNNVKKIPANTQAEIESRKKKYFAAKERYEDALSDWQKEAVERHEKARRKICDTVEKQLNEAGVELKSISFEDVEVEEE
ncbi:uncharacterized protein EKO05_0000825 [Ascochyta rabiei]|uniref:Uncharacterized protein n=1 Tax=Didymella rabiei TaxID=5454 RepID=A0A163CIF1_DIDRA|nr:uncharacterized protein EKO05_0000825 [Ascochyta rabiei]KZM22486.1 hypothetical protein ST47_g6374 [Ascochyta rabiei]UPX10154.1 hypothetical protein EKO05_0000825 [Ascochyta rabiei]